MTQPIDEIFRFETTHFTVVVDVFDEEDSPLDSFDNGLGQEVLERIEAGALAWFRVRCRVLGPADEELGSDHLGGCCYASFREFREYAFGAPFHRRKLRRRIDEKRKHLHYVHAKRPWFRHQIAGLQGEIAELRRRFGQWHGVQGGDYFSDMVRAAIAEARTTWNARPDITLHP